jgi:LysR family transcriptional activator of nhaA
MLPLNYHHLYYFYVIAQEGSVSRAAKKLFITQPALSTQLMQFEKFLGFRLFERKGPRLSLNSQGLLVLEYARSIVDLGKDLQDRLADFPKEGRVRFQLGVSGFVPKTLVLSLIQFIKQLRSDIFLIVTEHDSKTLQNKLNEHMLDLVLSHELPASENLDLYKMKIVAQIPVAFWSNKPIKMGRPELRKILGELPMIMADATSYRHQLIYDYFLDQGVAPKVVAEVQDIETSRRMVVSGLGVAPLNLVSATQAPGSEKLFRVGALLPEKFDERYYAFYKKRKINHFISEEILSRFYANGK